ncbi:MAG: hypothetical protein UU49_C0041G0004 [Candidatus Magasanikbacteria bacterium GW2011_GWC2_41_17]|uniref:Uncharacterized protein n=1 Tax=Candidatus Magasanikbacteria bacterium GW2011_GWC2_41_17 TaxID=1619048 RepID=A0A0G0XIX6_9BACT|nr:MAG: hypothetical protein UU49_C0041G0004 [Candidatus Magasanikbacteria bacterium GW2011_GWC2_41_17]
MIARARAGGAKFCGGGARLRRGFGGQARAGKNSFPPTPFLFARLRSVVSVRPAAAGRQSIVSFKKSSNFVVKIYQNPTI